MWNGRAFTLLAFVNIETAIEACGMRVNESRIVAASLSYDSE